MQLKDAADLLRPAAIDISSPSTWADLGCGDGLFTRALASLLAPGSTIYAVDRQPGITTSAYNGVHIIPVNADFEKEVLSLPPLDGLLMANSLHYVADKERFFKQASTYFRQAESYLLVEYDTEVPVARYVPYPLSFVSLQALWQGTVQRLGQYKSRYGGSMYSALLTQPGSSPT